MINEITALSCRDFRPHSKPWLHSTLASQVFAPSTPAPTPLRAWSTDAIFCFPRLILHILCKHLLLRGGFDLQLKKKNNLLMQGKKISQYISSQMGKPLCHSRDFRYPVEEITLQPWIPVTVIQRWRYQWCCVNWAVAKCTVPAPPLGGIIGLHQVNRMFPVTLSPCLCILASSKVTQWCFPFHAPGTNFGATVVGIEMIWVFGATDVYSLHVCNSVTKSEFFIPR